MGIAAKRILEREDNSMKTALAAAQQSSFLDTAAFPIIIVVIAIIAILAILASGYVKAPPDQAYIISGLKKESKILIGRAGIKIPFLERMDKLYLGQMTVDIKTEQSVPTNDFINVNVDAVAKVRINPTTDGIKLAAKNFLNKKPGDIALDLQDSLQGNMREIIGTLSLKVINTDRDSFSDQVMMKASKDMDKLGIEILSCNIQNVTDENGLIKDLGADNTSLIKKNAAIAKAQIVTVKSSRHRQSCSSARKRQKQRSSSSSRMQRQRKPWQRQFDLPESRKQKVSVQLVLQRQKPFVQRQQQRPKV